MKTALPSKAVMTPAYWQDACRHLARKDRVMKRLIPQFGDACLESRGDAFTTLARSIVGQQISVKAAQTVWDRFAVLPRKMVPPSVLRLKVDDMRKAGLSARKVEYLVDLALHFDSGAIAAEASLVPIVLEIRNHKSCLEYVREEAKNASKRSAAVTNPPSAAPPSQIFQAQRGLHRCCAQGGDARRVSSGRTSIWYSSGIPPTTATSETPAAALSCGAT